MRVGLPEAVDLLKKWSEDKSVVRCEGNFSTFAFSVNGRILAANESELRIMSDDTHSELVLRLSPQTVIEFADSRAVTGDEKKYDSCVIVFFGDIPSLGPADTIAIAVEQ